MRFSPIRQVILFITLGTFLGAGMIQAAWPVQATASPGMAMVTPAMVTPGAVTPADGGAPMPCKGKVPTCMTDLGCIFMIGLPAVSPALTMTRLSLSRIHYGDLAQLAGGFTRKPALDPPIFPG